MGLTTAHLLRRLTTAYYKRSGGNNEKLADIFRQGYWEGIEDDLATLRTESMLLTMTDVEIIELWQRQWIDVAPRPDESLASYRLRVKGALARKVAGTHPNAIMEVVEGMIDGELGDVTIVENEDFDTGNFRRAYFYLQFPVERLTSQGFTDAEITQALADIEEVVNQLAAAGVLGEIKVQGGAEWDSGMWDTAGDVWGS
jgi:hypothetical protein